ncbi:DgyrCDS61 [Dimorphilus gyrociliatus]|uniref:Solute carrier family 12 member 8 n=1 Tax=Dimorphilus gyrociliatus TaxID=2664684 RepID=A0A7I8V512_9ANNE|nr:DgyrCDS61 [Dimorphilus gyrociliatus]
MEQSSLVEDTEDKRKKAPDWERFGLSNEQRKETEKGQEVEGIYQDDSQRNELFSEDQSARSKPWWMSTFFITEPVLFGTWDGVFTSCMINIFGVVIFLRTGWMVGNAGIGFSMLIILMTIAVALIAVMSAIGVCERCRMESGGVYFLISHVLGSRIGASVGIVYCFGQAVACSLYVVGFGESIAALFNNHNEWVSRGIAIGVVFLLLGINVAGVKWVIRLQLLLLTILFVAVLDFLVGSFVHTDPDHGFIGYDSSTLANNTHPGYLPGETFFTVFGVFFPTATGVFAGINMSGDLKNPARNIPIGTLSAVGVSSFLYLAFSVVLGATCLRDVLQTDYMIAEKVSVLGVIWLFGLYVASLSGASGACSPRVLHAIADSGVIKPIAFLQHTVKRGANKVPVYALVVVTLVTLLFIFIGNVNTLGPIVTMPFMLTYAAVDYTYFALAMSFDKRSKREKRYAEGLLDSEASPEHKSASGYGSIKKKDDLDNLFPERRQHEPGQQEVKPTNDLNSPTFYETEKNPTNTDDTTGLLDSNAPRSANAEITRQPRSFYSFFCNRWFSLIGCAASLLIMFSIQWIYALCNIAVVSVVFLYIGQTNPGVFPGIAEFSLFIWIRDGVKNCCRRGDAPQEQMIIQSTGPNLCTKPAQLTEDNEDFAERGRYHQSEVVKRENFDDYD